MNTATSLKLTDTADGRNERFEDHLYLLSEEGFVLGARTALPEPRPGQEFFATFPLVRGVGKEVQSALRDYDARPILAPGARGPMLMICTPFRAARMFAVAVPTGELARAFRAPAAFCEMSRLFRLTSKGYVGECVNDPACAPKMLAYLRRWHMAMEWCAHLPDEVRAVAETLAVSAREMALIAGCRIAYDFSGLGQTPLRDEADWPSIRAFLLTVALAARRADRARTLELYADREGAGAYLHAVIRPVDGEPAVPEYAALRTALAMRGQHFREQRLPDGRLQFSLAICRTPISLQGVKSLSAPDLSWLQDEHAASLIAAAHPIPFDAPVDDEPLFGLPEGDLPTSDARNAIPFDALPSKGKKR